MPNPEFHFHPPNKLKRLGEAMRVYEVSPYDIVPHDEVGPLLKKYPDLAGDPSIGRSDFEGNCQSWKGCPGWWKSFVKSK